MPFPGVSSEICYMLGPVNKSFSPAQLAPSQIHYLSDLPVGGSNSRSPFPLRAHGGEKSPTLAPNLPLNTQSILSGRQRSFSRSPRTSLERSDSVEDPSNSEDSDDGESRTVIRLREPPLGSRRPRPNAHFAPILKTCDLKKFTKKTVQFADDLGFDLTRIHLFRDEFDGYWEPDPVPREDRFKSSKTGQEDLLVEISEWQVNFSQPAADYLGFREKLEANFVSLENVIIKQKTNSFMGTVKVKNVSFKKDIFVRCTFNQWETFSDYPAKYVDKGSASSDVNDTFSFEITIPEEAERRHVVEFCIGFRTDGQEFWDSNNGKNYQLITSSLKQKKSAEKFDDAYKIDTSATSWGQFASWNQLNNQQPYW